MYDVSVMQFNKKIKHPCPSTLRHPQISFTLSNSFSLIFWLHAVQCYCHSVNTIYVPAFLSIAGLRSFEVGIEVLLICCEEVIQN